MKIKEKPMQWEGDVKGRLEEQLEAAQDKGDRNKERSLRASLALLEYRRVASFPNYEPEDDEETLLTDLLTDLRHRARRQGLNFSKSLKLSVEHFLEETEKEEGSR